ncbi:MAG: fluoride efflux transporter CrcB [Alphaproteobacteria bacterium]|nr:fluoride efflux transporter CrcB [Alphaproteobacteria bacterium]
MQALLFIFLGGGTGAVCRYATSLLAGRWLGAGFPYGTLIINLIGAFLIGLIVELLALKFSANPQLKLLLVTGFLGGYTTFSAFSLETALMLQRGDYALGLIYVLVSVLGTVALVFTATALARQIL